MVKISVVVPTLNEKNYIGSLLGSLKRQLRKGDEIVVVDSHSSDGTAKISRKYTKNVFFMPRMGIGPAKTFGAKRAKNEVIVFVDADSVVPPNWLDGIREAFAVNPADVFWGFSTFMSDSKCKHRFYVFGGKLQYFICDIIHKISGVRFVSPNNCAFRRSIFLKVGGYRPVIYEDWDLAVRMKKLKDIRYHFDPNSTVMVSDRRLRKIGVFRAIVHWSLQVMNILTSEKRTNSKLYLTLS